MKGFLVKIHFHCNKAPKSNNYYINSDGFAYSSKKAY